LKIYYLYNINQYLKTLFSIATTRDLFYRNIHVTGVIDYAQRSVNDFLDNIRKAFGCEFFVTEDNRSVNIVFWNDILEPIVMKEDYTPYLEAKSRTEFVEPKTIKLTFKRSFDSSDVPYSTLSEFEEKFGKLNSQMISLPTSPGDLSNTEVGFYFVRNIARYGKYILLQF